MPNRLQTLGSRLRQYGQPLQTASTPATATMTPVKGQGSTPASSLAGQPTSRLRAGILEFMETFISQVKTSGARVTINVKGMPLTIPMPALEGVFWAAKKQLDAASDEQLE